MGLFSKDELLGLDIGSNSIKAVELDWRKKPKLKLFGMVTSPGGHRRRGFHGFGQHRGLHPEPDRGLKVKTRTWRFDLRPSVYIKTINVPNMSKDSWKRASSGRRNSRSLRHRRCQHRLPDPGHQTGSGPDAVLLVAAKKDMINDYTAVIEERSDPTIVDVDSCH